MIVKTIVFPFSTADDVFVSTDYIKPEQLRRFKDSKKKYIKSHFICPKIIFTIFEEETDYDEV